MISPKEWQLIGVDIEKWTAAQVRGRKYQQKRIKKLTEDEKFVLSQKRIIQPTLSNEQDLL